eukprot:Gb_34968 [translate_table: standard]
MANQMKGKGQPVNWSYSAKQSQLPPKSPFPTMGPAFVDCGSSPFTGQRSFPHTRGGYRQHQRTSSESFLIEEQPSWLDDLLNEPETPVKKGSHRRSASDSVTFLEVPTTYLRIENIAEEEEYDINSIASFPLRGSLNSDRVDKESRQTYFCGSKLSEKPPVRSWDASLSSGTSYKSGSNSSRDCRKTGNLVAPSLSHNSEDVSSSSTVAREEPQEHVHNVISLEGRDSSRCKSVDCDIDPKRAKQQFAQRSRVRKLQYISELERNVSALQAEESEVSAEVSFLNQQLLILTLENKALKQRIAGLAQETMFKDAQHELLKKEAQRLRILYQQQQLQQHSPLQLNQVHHIPTCADFDLQQLQFSKLSLGSLKQVESKPAFSDSVYGRVKNIGGMPAVCGDDDGTACKNGRAEIPKSNVPCMIAGGSKTLDGRRMMTGGGHLPVDFMLQKS